MAADYLIIISNFDIGSISRADIRVVEVATSLIVQAWGLTGEKASVQKIAETVILPNYKSMYPNYKIQGALLGTPGSGGTLVPDEAVKKEMEALEQDIKNQKLILEEKEAALKTPSAAAVIAITPKTEEELSKVKSTVNPNVIVPGSAVEDVFPDKAQFHDDAIDSIKEIKKQLKSASQTMKGEDPVAFDIPTIDMPPNYDPRTFNSKKAVLKDGLPASVLAMEENTPQELKGVDKGIAGDKLNEPVPYRIDTPSENVIKNDHNAWIILGRDRPASRMSGYGGLGHTQAGCIDLCVGMMGARPRSVNLGGEKIYADPNFKIDSARIYMSQKTKIDEHFGLVAGSVGNPIPRSAIGLKADGIRLVAREGIKLVTGTDAKNSQGGRKLSVAGIDLIAGNDDTDLEPLVKGEALVRAFEKLVEYIEGLNGILDSHVLYQMKFNSSVATHWHFSPWFAQPTTPSTDCAKGGSLALIKAASGTKTALATNRKNLIAWKINFTKQVGADFICSRFNNTN